jgi:SSS family transporter
MRAIDWAVLAFSLVFVVAYGLWRGRGSDTVSKYLLAEKTMPWYAMALSIMATQASAITFISTTGQAYVDGMRFVQFYFGLPLAMVLVCAFFMPVFYRANVYTAYEYLERRFDAKTRALVSIIFLIQRGLAVGIALSAPAVVLTVIIGLPAWITTIIMGVTVIAYTVMGGIQAVTWTDFQQMLIMFAGLFVALGTAIWLLPVNVSFMDAVALAGAAGKLNPVVLKFDWNDQYNLWSGLFGGMFLMLAYFGCDQSQVQRYLTGKSIAQSRLSLLFNAVAKIPMQFFILFTGAMVFVFFTFEKPPMVFQHAAMEVARTEAQYAPVQRNFDNAYEQRRMAATKVLEARRSGDESRMAQRAAEYRASEQTMEAAHKDGIRLAGKAVGEPGLNDTNYIFLSFVTRYMPVGVVGLIMAAIFAAAMSTISAEVNSLATVSVIDVYKRHMKKDATDRHYLAASRWATAFWGLYAVITAEFSRNLGSLVVAVNMLGSLFYGGLLGIFVLAFFFKRVGGTAAFIGVLVGEAAIFSAHYFTKVGFLWYNVIGCLVVIATGLLLSFVWEQKQTAVTP